MNTVEWRTQVHNWQPRLPYPYAADKEYMDVLCRDKVYRMWRRWKYGFLGFGGKPVYVPNRFDCENETSDFINYCCKNLSGEKAPPMFRLGADDRMILGEQHSYVAFRDETGDLSIMDLRDGQLCEPENVFVLGWL